MPKNSLSNRFHLKASTRLWLLNAPDGFEKQLSPLPASIEVLTASPRKSCDAVILFAMDLSQLTPLLPRAQKALAPDGLLWLSFPKKSSGQQTDLNMYSAREAAHTCRLDGVAIISIDDTWSACLLKAVKG